MNQEEELLVWAILLCFTRGVYQRKLAMFDRQVLDINEPEAFFLIELILSGNYESDMMEKVFAMPMALQEEIKRDFRN